MQQHTHTVACTVLQMPPASISTFRPTLKAFFLQWQPARLTQVLPCYTLLHLYISFVQ